MNIEQLQDMRRQMLRRGNWKEVERLNKIIHFQRESLELL